MLYIVPIQMLTAAGGILFIFTVNRRASVARTFLCVTFSMLWTSFVWDYWRGWHSTSGNEALQYSIAFVLACVTLAALLTALGRRLWWLRHHQHDDWMGRSQ